MSLAFWFRCSFEPGATFAVWLQCSAALDSSEVPPREEKERARSPVEDIANEAVNVLWNVW